MNVTLRHAVIAAMGLVFALPAAATAPGWYLQGELGYTKVDDADSTIEADSDFNPGTAGAASSCGLGIGNLLCLFPVFGSPGTPGTFDPGSQRDASTEFDDETIGAFGAAVGYAWQDGLRGELELRQSSNDVAEVEDSQIEATALLANVWWSFQPKSDWHPYIGLGVGAAKIALEDPALSGDDTVLAYQGGLGIEFDLNETVALGVGYRYFGTDDPEFNENRLTLKTEYQQHLLLATLRWVFERAALEDSDQDGVADINDKCPNTPAGTSVDASGCPLDSDGDGVPDDLDKCPNTPAGVPVNAEGCALDSDGDGIPDYKDECPNTPAGIQVNAKGCPLVIDSDGDGVPDDRDMCPNTPPGVPVLTNGCAVGQGVVLEGVNFLFNEATLTPSAETILLNVAQTLKDSPGFEIEVAGHTDSIGTDAYNLALSQRRVDSVVDFLVAQGVERDRLNPVGYGETRPIAPNTNPDGSDNPEGRAQNRRVELNVIGRN